jgi:ABC-type branched-subunit amino acid transport system ATPase component
MNAESSSPAKVRSLFDRLQGHRENRQRSRDERAAERAALLEYLAIADEVRQTLDKFSEELFADLVNALQVQLTAALSDVLDQPLQLKVERDLKNNAVTLGFFVERAGEREDIMKGQGGSVVNVLSVGLRILALQAVDEKEHRKFLVLDEQDCWLRPDLVPRLVQIVSEAGRKMGFQVLMISHHDPGLFEKYADRIYRCRPRTDESGTHVVVEQIADVAQAKGGSG